MLVAPEMAGTAGEMRWNKRYKNHQIRRYNAPKSATSIFCPHCRCEFEANSIEYCLTDQLAQIHDNIIAECICPCCGQMAYSYGN